MTVLIGRLHHVVPEVLQNHYRILRKEHPLLSRTRLVIEIAPVRITCRACGQETVIEQTDLRLFCLPIHRHRSHQAAGRCTLRT